MTGTRITAHDTEFGRRLAWIRKARQQTQQDLAAAIPGMHRTTLAKIEKGKRPATITEAILLAAALDCSLNALVGAEPLAVSAIYEGGV